MENQYKTRHFELNLYQTGKKSILPEKLSPISLTYAVQVFEKFIFDNTEYRFLNKKSTKKVVLSLTICGKQKIKTINKQFRQKDKITDVLSFQNEDLRSKQNVALVQNTLDLGDLLICKEVCLSQSKKFDISFEEEFLHLLVHGFLHLTGYDHEVSLKEEKLMNKHEENLVELIFKKIRKSRGK